MVLIDWLLIFVDKYLNNNVEFSFIGFKRTKLNSLQL